MSKSKQKNQQRSSIKQNSSKEETATQEYRFRTLFQLSGILGSLAIEIGDRKPIRIWKRHKGKLNQDDALLHIKEFKDTINGAKEVARDVRNWALARPVEIAIEAMKILNVLDHIFEEYQAEIELHSIEDENVLRDVCLDIHEDAKKYYSKLRELSADLEVEAIEPYSGEVETYPPDPITISNAEKNYYVSRRTLLRDIKDKKIKSHRDGEATSKHILSEKRVAALYLPKPHKQTQ